ncbi:exportin 7 [Anaeramoeba ignava]|uniref:Exportin 7 n=1 Tax=Anaeramoeba ignava TaxID=1746090 RepID=A0A9Q0LFE7_ANAIG|nr:exportin 7 [Anaeramoeba ignava]
MTNLRKKEIEEINELATQCLTSQDPTKRQNAEVKLRSLTNSIIFIDEGPFFLQQTNCKYTQIFISNELFNLLTKHWHSIQHEQIEAIFNTIMNIFTQKSLDPNAEKSLIKTIGRIIKLDWDILNHNSQFVNQIQKRLFSSRDFFNDPNFLGDNSVLGFKVYMEMIYQFSNIIQQKETLILHKRKSASFRDHQLIFILQKALTYLAFHNSNADYSPFENSVFYDEFNDFEEKKFNSLINEQNQQYSIRKNRMSNQHSNESINIINICIDVVFTCFSYNFHATRSSEKASSSDFITIQFPNSWRYLFESQTTIKLLFDYYNLHPSNLGSKILEVLFLISSTRASIFSKESKRDEFFEDVISGISTIIQSKRGIDTIENFHSLSRLLFKIVTSLSILEFSNLKSAPHLLELTAFLTLDILQNCSGNLESYFNYFQNGIDYLIRFWIQLYKHLYFSSTSIDPSISANIINSNLGINRSEFANYIQIIFESYVQLIINVVKHQFESGNLFEDQSWILDSMLLEKIQIGAELGKVNVSSTINFYEQLYRPNLESFRNFSTNLLINLSQLNVNRSSQDFRDNTANNQNANSKLPKFYGEDLSSLVIPSMQISVLNLFITSSIKNSVGITPLEARMEFVSKLSSLVYDFYFHINEFFYSNEEDINNNDNDNDNESKNMSTSLNLNLSPNQFVDLENHSLPSFLGFVELSFLHFLQNTQVDLLNLSEQLMDNEESKKYTIILQRTIKNFIFWSDSEQIISESITLFSSIILSRTFKSLSTTPQLLDLIVSEFIRENFFLLSSSRNRTFRRKFMEIVSRGLFISSETSDVNQPLRNLVSNFEFRLNQFDKLITSKREGEENNNNNIINNSNNEITTDKLQFMLAVISDDFRGFLSSIITQKQFTRFFEWFSPKYSEFFKQLTKNSFENPELLDSFLKFWIEFSHNRYNRINSSGNSSISFKVFRQVGEIVLNYCQFIFEKEESLQSGMETTGEFGDMLSLVESINSIETRLSNMEEMRWKFKSIANCHRILSFCLSSELITFGYFKYYNDSLVKNMVVSGILLMKAIPNEAIPAFPEFTKRFYHFLEIVTDIHLEHIAELTSEEFSNLIKKIHIGLKINNKIIVSRCCFTLDHIFSFYSNIYNNPLQRNIEKINIANLLNSHFANNPDILRESMKVLMDKLIYELYYSHWSLSRALLDLIVIDETFFEEMKNRFISELDQESQPKGVEIFQILMRGVEKNLEPENRNIFSQNVTLFLDTIKEVGIV